MTNSETIVNDLNEQSYFSPTVLRMYKSYTLTRTEVIAFLKYHQYFAGKDVLDIGIGTGRTTVYLAPFAKKYEGIDFAPPMIEFMKKAMPHISTRLGDMRDLKDFSNEQFDFVMGSFNVIDEVTFEERLQTLSTIYRVLKPGGIFMFSSHNLSWEFAGESPRFSFSKNPYKQAKYILKWFWQWWHHLKVKRFRIFKEGYAFLNDEGHHFSALHCYLDPTLQRRQLAEKKFTVLDVFDEFGNSVSESDIPKSSPYLMYVAKK